MTQPALFQALQVSPSATAAPMPDWLLRRLDTEGHIDLASGATRRARPVACQKCGAWTVRGLDADMAALTASCDPHPLAPTGEALARLAGLWTFTLEYLGGKMQLSRRNGSRITYRPAGVGQWDVLAEHQCQQSLPLPRAPSSLPIPIDPGELPEDPPF